jgi:hypothetical protein
MIFGLGKFRVSMHFAMAAGGCDSLIVHYPTEDKFGMHNDEMAFYINKSYSTQKGVISAFQ